MRGGDLPDRVAGQVSRAYAEGHDEPEERHFEGEQRRLGVAGLVEQRGLRRAGLGEDDGGDRCRPAAGPARRPRRRTPRRTPGTPRKAPGPCAPAARPGRRTRTPCARTRRAPARCRAVAPVHDGGAARRGVGAAGAGDHRPVLERRTRRSPASTRRPAGTAGSVRRTARAGRPGRAGRRGVRADSSQRHDRGRVRGSGARLRSSGALQDDVGVGAADAERGDARAAGPPGLRPGTRLGAAARPRRRPSPRAATARRRAASAAARRGAWPGPS